jgi:hypothetical protein
MAGTPIYRAPMRARDRDLPPGTGADAGLEHGFVGIGPGEGEKALRMADRFAALPDGTLVWTRASDGTFHVGCIGGPLRRPRTAPAGLTHVRPARWLPHPLREDEVPAAVLATFARGGRNLQRIHDDAAERRTAEIWAGGG